MVRKLLGIISVEFDTSGSLLIVYTAFVKYGWKKREYNEAVQKLSINLKEVYV